VHKAQGLTLDRAEMQMNNAFAPGQTYVALSRVKRCGFFFHANSLLNHANCSLNHAHCSLHHANCSQNQRRFDLDGLWISRGLIGPTAVIAHPDVVAFTNSGQLFTECLLNHANCSMQSGWVVD
jgi:hypothetical protein